MERMKKMSGFVLMIPATEQAAPNQQCRGFSSCGAHAADCDCAASMRCSKVESAARSVFSCCCC
jgi:hypothetical protein